MFDYLLSLEAWYKDTTCKHLKEYGYFARAKLGRRSAIVDCGDSSERQLRSTIKNSVMVFIHIWAQIIRPPDAVKVVTPRTKLRVMKLIQEKQSADKHSNETQRRHEPEAPQSDVTAAKPPVGEEYKWRQETEDKTADMHEVADVGQRPNNYGVETNKQT